MTLAGVGALAAVGVLAWLVLGRGAPEPSPAPPVTSAPAGVPAATAAARPAATGPAANGASPDDAPAGEPRVPSSESGGDTALAPTATPVEAPVPKPAAATSSGPARALVAAPRARVAVDATALARLDDRALEATLGALLRDGDFARWESSLAALPADGMGAYARGRHLALFERLQAEGLSLDATDALSRAAGAPAARVVDALLAEAPRLDRAGAKGRPSPPARNAVDAYRMVLALDPANAAARRGLDELIADFRSAARTARERGNEAAAERLDERARAVDPEAFAPAS
jgi:hypothetical protein